MRALPLATAAILLAGCVVTAPGRAPCAPGSEDCKPFQAWATVPHVTAPMFERPVLEADYEVPDCYLRRDATHPDCAGLGAPMPPVQSHGMNASGMWSMTGGVAVADVDGDGCQDLHFAEHGPDHLYLGDCLGGLRDVSQRLAPHADGNTTMGLFLDYDNDGDPDLFLANILGPSRLLRNDGGHFTDVGRRAGIERTTPAYGAAAADVDNDGWPDLLVANYYRWHDGVDHVPGGRDEPELLYINQRDGTFLEMAAAWGLGGDGPTLAAGFTDYDQDGWMDLALANDFGENTTVWRNDGGRRFVRADVGVESRRDGMGIVWADLDGNGWQDLYVSNIFESLFTNPQRRGNTLFLNQGGRFVDHSVASDAFDAGWAWGGAAFDADSDGDVDLYVPNGYIEARSPIVNPDGPHGPPAFAPPGAGLPPALAHYVGTFQANRFFENQGGAHFQERGKAWGVADRVDGRAAATVDLDRDGAVDLVTTAVARNPLVRANLAPQGASLALHLEGQAYKDAWGALVLVGQGNATRVFEKQAGSGFLSQSTPWIHVGLGPHASAEVRVLWPGGEVQDLGTLDAGAYEVLQGTAPRRV